MPTSLLSFMLGAIYESLPSPSTLHGWNITTKNSCKLWQKECTTVHVLGGWNLAFQQDRFFFSTWTCSADPSLFQFFLSSYTVSKTKSKTSVKLVQALPIPQKTIKKKVCLLQFAPDWKLVWPQQCVGHSFN